MNLVDLTLTWASSMGTFKDVNALKELIISHR